MCTSKIHAPENSAAEFAGVQEKIPTEGNCVSLLKNVVTRALVELPTPR